MQDKRINAGYEIIQSFPVGNTEFVLGENVYDRARYVTWECSEDSYFWGHYFTDKEAATKDLYDRIEAEVAYQRSKGEVPKDPPSTKPKLQSGKEER